MLLRLLLAKPRPTSFRHSTFPFLRSRHRARSFFDCWSSALRKIRFSQTIGVPAPGPGSFTCHAADSLSSLSGRFFASLEPFCFGPRHCGQFSAHAGRAIAPAKTIAASGSTSLRRMGIIVFLLLRRPDVLPPPARSGKARMTHHPHPFIRTALLFIALAPGATLAADWPAWGGGPSRNMVSGEKNLPAKAELGDAPEGDQLTADPAKSIKWVARLGNQTYGNPTVAGGRVFVVTNNEPPRDPKHEGDRGVLMCFDEASGKFLWQLAVPKHGAGRNVDWEFIGLCSSPTVDGDRVYVVTNRCEIVCLDINGLANGNDGPFKEEAAYLAEIGRAH